jgi:hypothetical protein
MSDVRCFNLKHFTLQIAADSRYGRWRGCMVHHDGTSGGSSVIGHRKPCGSICKPQTINRMKHEPAGRTDAGRRTPTSPISHQRSEEIRAIDQRSEIRDQRSAIRDQRSTRSTSTEHEHGNGTLETTRRYIITHHTSHIT